MDVLFEELKESLWVYDSKFDHKNKLELLFLAHPRSVALAQRFHHIAIMDSTYKTNAYHWPLFHVVGLTSTKKTFTVAIVFM